MTYVVRRFAADESGATAIEYGLIAAGIAVAIIVAVNAVGKDLSSLFGRVSAKLRRRSASIVLASLVDGRFGGAG